MQINHFALKTVMFVAPRDTVVLTRSTYRADGSVLVVSCSVEHAAAPKADRVRARRSVDACACAGVGLCLWAGIWVEWYGGMT